MVVHGLINSNSLSTSVSGTVDLYQIFWYLRQILVRYMSDISVMRIQLPFCIRNFPGFTFLLSHLPLLL